jgi:hypothetical protein
MTENEFNSEPENNKEPHPFRIDRANWSLPDDLRAMVEEIGEASESKYLAFIKAALSRSVDIDRIIKACLLPRVEGDPAPVGAAIFQFARQIGEAGIKADIERILNTPPTLGKEGRIQITIQRGHHTDMYWRAVEQAVKATKSPVFVHAIAWSGHVGVATQTRMVALICRWSWRDIRSCS